MVAAGGREAASAWDEALTHAFTSARCEADAEAMAHYMRDQFPFHGLRSPARRALQREVAAATLPRRPEPDLLRGAAELAWRRPEREHQYAAIDLLVRHAKALGPGDLPWLRDLVCAKAWWDSVDALAKAVGEIVRRSDTAAAVMDDWSRDANLWVRRVSIIHQLRFKDATDVEALQRHILGSIDDDDFFARKAIGWALRQYARTDADWVRSFVERHRDRLSALSIREATKHLDEVA